jgi:radical SAM protein with 4Fe4S-binding SPASM domain
MLRKTTRRYVSNKLSQLSRFHWGAMLRKVSLRRLAQAAFVVLEWKAHRSHCYSRPIAFRVESSGLCNLRCPLCSTTFRTLPAGQPRNMSLELFETIHAQLKKSAWRLTFYMEGEPMMNPRLFEMIEIATRNPHVFTSFSTNFTLMRERLLAPLFKSRIDWISVSIDGFRQETYEKYRVNGRVEDVLNGIAMTTRFKCASKLNYPYMQVNMITFSHVPADETKALASFCAAHDVDEFRLRPDQTGLLGPYPGPPKRRPARSCHWPWTSMSVDVDGSVYVCPIAFEQRISYGNLGTTTLDELWNNDMYVATRTYLSRKGDDRDGLPKLPCYDCRWYGKCEPSTDQEAVRRERLRKAKEAGMVNWHDRSVAVAFAILEWGLVIC